MIHPIWLCTKGGIRIHLKNRKRINNYHCTFKNSLNKTLKNAKMMKRQGKIKRTIIPSIENFRSHYPILTLMSIKKIIGNLGEVMEVLQMEQVDSLEVEGLLVDFKTS